MNHPEKHIPLIIYINENIEYAYDAAGEVYELITAEYQTTGFYYGDDRYKVFLPMHPEKDIDDIWKNGTDVFDLVEKDGEYSVINTDRKVKIVKMKTT